MKWLRLFYLLIAICNFNYAHAIDIVFDNRTLHFSQPFISGITQHADSSHIKDRFRMIRFYVEGHSGQEIKVNIANNQIFENKESSEKLTIGRIHFDCNLSSQGTAKINNNGRTDLLCIGARIKIPATVSAGIYTASVQFEVNYK